MKALDFYFDFGSPAAYLAWTQLSGLARDAGAQVNLKPMLLGAVFKATGNHSPVTIPAKGAYTFIDFSRCARRMGVPLVRNSHFPIITTTLMRIAIALQDRGDPRLEHFLRTVFEACWVHDVNMNEPAEVGRVLAGAGFDPQALLALAGDEAVKERLKAATQEAIDRGVFGAPTFFVGDQMFWGQDRIEFVKEALQ